MTIVHLKTSLGDIKIKLDKENAPVSTENFLQYVKNNHYTDTIFHRVIPGFMIQGGGYNHEMKERKALRPITNESKNGLKNERGSIAMARTNDPHSATAQFFINLVDNDFLNSSGESWGYAVFGKVTEGLETIDAIAKVKTGRNGYHNDVPETPVVIEFAEIAE